MQFQSPRIRTGYSFRTAAGKLEEVADRLVELGYTHGPITDRSSTFGFFRWKKICEKKGLIPVFGVELPVSADIHDKRPSSVDWTFISIGSVRKVNQLVATATMQFRYRPLLTIEQALAATDECSVIIGHDGMCGQEFPDWDMPNLYYGVGPGTPRSMIRNNRGKMPKLCAVTNNFFPRADDRPFYEVLCGRGANDQTYDQFIQSEEEWLDSVKHLGLTDDEIKGAIWNANYILNKHEAKLLQAELPTPPRPDTLENMCRAAAPGLGVDLSDPVYEERLMREINLISEKNFDDYFYIVTDIVQWARERMFVGPARGSSCGSLVCYLLRITTIDPIPHKLIFERFIDVNRSDLPDIDIDFSDQNRHLVFKYIEDKYGAEYVARLGTVAMFHPKSILQEIGGAFGIPRWETDKVAEVIIERSSGDARALDTLEDSLRQMPAGQLFLESYPEAIVGTRMEGHPRHYSQHAAGIVITKDPVCEYVASDHRTGAIMCDKKDAEDGYGMLKIDALGLTQLSIFEDALEMAGLPRNHLESLPIDDAAAFEVLNKQQWAGIFQFNGLAMQSLTKQTTVTSFMDIVNITAMARPGPLTSGGATNWLCRKNGWDPRTQKPAKAEYAHPLFEPYLRETLGVVAFQEQVLMIGREIGNMTWEEVTALRKAMSKSLGEEFFSKYRASFVSGATKNGVPEDIASDFFDDMSSFGSWAMNLSHCVAYGMVSYWCCWLKAHHPFEFAAATLSHVSDPEKQIQMLREMEKEGIGYVPVDEKLSEIKWTAGFVDGKRVLVGPLSNVKGIGPKIMNQIMSSRARGEPLSDRAKKLLKNPKTPIDDLYPIATRIKELLPDPTARNIRTPVTLIGDVPDDHEEDTTFLIIGVVEVINPRDENEPIMVARRGYELTSGPLKSLNIQMKDDTGIIYCKINRFKFAELGKQIIDRGRAGKAIYAIRGTAMAKRRFLMVDRVKYIGDMEA